MSLSKRRLALLVLVLGLVAVIGGIAGAGAWILYTEAGLAWVASRARTTAGEGLTMEGVAGTLASGTRAKFIRYAGKDIEVRVTDAYLRVSAFSLLTLTPRLGELRAGEILVTSKPTEPRGRPPDTLELPLNVELPDVQVTRLVIDLGKGPLDLENVRLNYSGGRARHTVHNLALAAFEYTLELRGSISARAPFDLKGEVNVTRTELPEGRLSASVTGNLSDIELDGSAVSGEARVAATAHVQPYAQLPLARVKAQISHLDLKAYAKNLPRTAIEGVLELTRTGPLLSGPVRLTNALHGPYDQGRLPVAALRMDVRTDVGRTRRFDLSADLGAGGAISGSGALEGEQARLALSTKALNLKGLHTRMRETRLAGRADLVLTKAKQSANAQISEGDITLRLVAHRSGSRIEVPEFTARARGGEASGEARIVLDERQPFSIKAAFRRFDPAAWGDFVPGSINGTVTAAGTVSPREADVKLAIADSRWLDSPLAATGIFTVEATRLRNAKVDLTLGGNTLNVQGAFGAPKDVLALRIDAPRLGVLDQRIQGTVRGTAEVSGSFRDPGIRFDLTASQLAYGNLGRIEAVTARGVVSTNPQGPANIDATFRGIVTPEARLQSAALRVEGTRAAHSGTLQARGERVDFRARARGGLTAGRGWSGTLEELVNAGEAAVRLAAPVSIAIGPQRARAEPFELRVVGGRLNVTALDYERGRLVTSGRFNDLPLRPLLAMAGAQGSLAGTLRLSGEWSIQNVPRLAGNVRITRESGDVAFGADRTISLGLQTLAVNLNLTEQGAVFDARIASTLASASAEGRATPVGGPARPRYTSASPVEFTASVDIARLAPFANLVDTTMILEGEAHAKVRGVGTLGDPLITGPITADRLAIALPAEGIELKGGVLRANLAQREIRVESFTIKGGEGVFHAQGTLARTGFDEASVDWRAEQFMMLGRPDRRLVVSGKGNAALKGGKLAFTGAVRAHEGLFELAENELPKLGDDVIVVGRERGGKADPAPPPAAARKSTRTTVDMSIDFGNNVQLRGRGLDVWLSGELKVRTDAQGLLRASGTIDARRGTFSAYGQRLEIDRARLYFNGPFNNPGLDILAMRKRQAVEAGVAVTGTLSRPLVRVVSEPPLPDGEALSWLVLGRAPDQAGAGQLAALPLATSLLMGKAGAPIARTLHVDEIGMRQGGGATAQQFVTVGKRITDRLYLAFEQSLGGTESLLRLEMSLTQRISLRAQAGIPSSLGVFYRYSWD